MLLFVYFFFIEDVFTLILAKIIKKKNNFT